MADTNERITRMARMAERLREHAASVSDEECRDAWTQEAADIDWLIARATATPPADAALADALDRVANVGAVIDIGLLKQAAAALRARAVPEGKKYHDVAQRLYALLDDIDTAGDIAKSDDKLYRGIVERTQAKKRDFVVSCDGYTVTLADDSMLTASKEAK